MNNITYKGYDATIEYDNEDEIFVGHLAGIRDIVSFHGINMDELKTAFYEAVDHYLAICKKRGEKAQKPYFAILKSHVPSEVHNGLVTVAEA